MNNEKLKQAAEKLFDKYNIFEAVDEQMVMDYFIDFAKSDAVKEYWQSEQGGNVDITDNEIQEMAEASFPKIIGTNSTGQPFDHNGWAKTGFIRGFNKAIVELSNLKPSEASEGDAVKFIEWVMTSNENYCFDDNHPDESDTSGMWSRLRDRKYFTTSELYTLFKQSKNK